MTGRSRPLASALALAALLGCAWAAGCGGGQTQGAAFDDGQLDVGPAMADLQRRLANAPIPRGFDVAVGVFGERSLVGVPLAGGEPWTFEHPITCRPVIAGSVVVGAGQNELFGLEAKTGKLLWTRKVGGCLRGAADNGEITVVSVRPITGFGGIVLAIDRDGQIVRQIEDDSKIGAPAVVDGFLFLPWSGKFVSAYDLAAGEEVARLRFSGRVTRAFTVGGALYFGETTATRFDEHIGLAPAGGAWTLALPARRLPGGPAWMESGIDALPAGALPSDRVHLYARPASGAAPAVWGGRYAATHGRVVMGLDAKDGALVWAHAHGAGFLGGAAYEGGFALCDAEGVITFLDAQTGATAGRASLGKPVDACLVQADGFSATKSEPRPLRDQIADVIRLQYEEAAPVQRFLLGELVTSADERATETLIDLYASGAAPEDVQVDVRSALAARRSGASFMLAALARRPDFLEGEARSTPVGPLADALAAAHVEGAAPLLAGHLVDPATPAADVERAAAALVVLARPADLPLLRQFFAMYRSEAADSLVVTAVAHVARALTRLGAAEVVATALSDPYTSEAVRAKLATIGTAAAAAGSPAR